MSKRSMSHSDICSTSYGQKKGRELNWQFDSRPLKVKNRPDPNACMWSATHPWKALEESYKFVLDLIPIGGLNKELWAPKVIGIQTRIVSGLLVGSPGQKVIRMWVPRANIENTIWGKVVASFESGCGESCESKIAHACPSTKGVSKSELTNLLVGLMQLRVSK
jgi:hypothetical protein